VASLTLDYPWDVEPEVDDVITLWPGCDRQRSTCVAKFDNYSRFRGFPFIPVGNPTTNPIQETNTSGGKK
jgi:hypothetical protein